MIHETIMVHGSTLTARQKPLSLHPYYPEPNYQTDRGRETERKKQGLTLMHTIAIQRGGVLSERCVHEQIAHQKSPCVADLQGL